MSRSQKHQCSIIASHTLDLEEESGLDQYEEQTPHSHYRERLRRQAQTSIPEPQQTRYKCLYVCPDVSHYYFHRNRIYAEPQVFVKNECYAYGSCRPSKQGIFRSYEYSSYNKSPCSNSLSNSGAGTWPNDEDGARSYQKPKHSRSEEHYSPYPYPNHSPRDVELEVESRQNVKRSIAGSQWRYDITGTKIQDAAEALYPGQKFLTGTFFLEHSKQWAADLWLKDVGLQSPDHTLIPYTLGIHCSGLSTRCMQI